MEKIMKGARFILNLGIFITLGLQGCLPLSTPSPVSQAAPDVTAVQPEIRSVEVLQSEVPQQVLLVVQAVLPNTCLRLGDASVERQGQEFTISLPSVKAAEQGCQAAPVSQEQVIRLPADPLSPGNYIVLVNGMLSSFRVSAHGQVQAGSSQPVAVTGAPADKPAAGQPAVNTAAEPAQVPSPTPTAEPPPVEPPAPLPTPTSAPLELAKGQDPANCVNKAAFYANLTVPDGTPFTPGSKFRKTWMVMNVGSCGWGPAYQLVFAGGDPLGAPQKIPMPYASPRQVVQVSVDMTAPVAPQNYESSWAIESPQGYVFGLGNPATTPLFAKINVVALPVGLPSGLACGALRQRDMEQQVLELINSTRAQYGLYPLTLVEDISKVALNHSLEQACYDRSSHFGLDGMLYNVRLQRNGILFATSNEIIYSGNGGPKGSLDWWMHSHIHKPIILSDKYTQVGIGYVYFDNNAYKQRITVDFIHP